jgi:hypothetical protein
VGGIRRMTNRELLLDNGYNDIIIFDNPSFDGAMIGVSSNDRAVYDYDKMVAVAMEQEGWTQEEAIDWIEFNILRSLPYIENAPIIVYSLYREEE